MLEPTEREKQLNATNVDYANEILQMVAPEHRTRVMLVLSRIINNARELESIRIAEEAAKL